MSAFRTAFLAREIFDGAVLRKDHALVVEGGRVAALAPRAELEAGIVVHALELDVICPGFVDLQVNGGGGVMLNDDQSTDALHRIASAHAGLGATSILPTLITDHPEKVVRAIHAVDLATKEGMPGILGLHLEGPHLAARRKGAHDAGFIRKMNAEDLELLCDAARRLPVLKLTLAPEAVSHEQISKLSSAGAIISLGHSDASFQQCVEAVEAGASCVTHLFNAMSQLGSREPGMVGAALGLGGLSAGLIADGAHVHPETIRVAQRSKSAPGRLFLVSDAMGVAGTDLGEFWLGGRIVRRRGNRLLLEDDTLAGADLELATAIRNLLNWDICDTQQALAMATSIPASIAGVPSEIGRLAAGGPADFVAFDLHNDDPVRVWRAGQSV